MSLQINNTAPNKKIRQITKKNQLMNKKINPVKHNVQNPVIYTAQHPVKSKSQNKPVEQYNNQNKPVEQYNNQNKPVEQYNNQNNQFNQNDQYCVQQQNKSQNNRIKLDKQSKSNACIHWIPLNEDCYACAKQSNEAFTMREHIPISFSSNLKNQQISQYNSVKQNPTYDKTQSYKIHSSTVDKLNSVNNRAFVNISGNTKITTINDPQRMAIFDRNKFNDSQQQNHNSSHSGQAYNGLYVNHNDQPRNVNHMYQPNQNMMESNLNESNLNVNTRMAKNNDSHEDFFLSRSLIADTRHGNRFFEIKPICDKKQNRLNE
jgi:hypothetical protein